MKPIFELIAGERLSKDFVYSDSLMLNNADRQFVQRLCDNHFGRPLQAKAKI
jgi:hypothetical protein